MDAPESSERLYAAWLSGLVNLLYLAPTICMLQICVVPTHWNSALLILAGMLLLAPSVLSPPDRVRMRLLIQAGTRLDTTLGGPEPATILEKLAALGTLRVGFSQSVSAEQAPAVSGYG